MEKLRSAIVWTIMLSETTHVFCCVLPTLFSMFSLLAGVGIISIMPAGLMAFHEFMHPYEIPMIGFSAAILGIGWALYYASQRIDCHDTGCAHGACAPKKNKALTVLKIATGMFLFNTIIYVIFHAGQ